MKRHEKIEKMRVPRRRPLRRIAATARSFARSVAGGAVAVWQTVLLGSRPAFVIDFEEGRASLRSGKAPAKFLQSCDEIAASASLATGTIRGVRDRRGISLVFSRDIPPITHQQFRNAWHLER
jgi:hypothetical protein